jgi:hypothetical protein
MTEEERRAEYRRENQEIESDIKRRILPIAESDMEWLRAYGERKNWHPYGDTPEHVAITCAEWVRHDMGPLGGDWRPIVRRLKAAHRKHVSRQRLDYAPVQPAGVQWADGEKLFRLSCKSVGVDPGMALMLAAGFVSDNPDFFKQRAPILPTEGALPAKGENRAYRMGTKDGSARTKAEHEEETAKRMALYAD